MKKERRSSKNRYGHKIRFYICPILAAIFIAVFASAVTAATMAGAGETGQETEMEQSEDTGLSIVVVEDISVHDQIIVEDEAVPLANFSEKKADDGFQHAVMMGIVLIAVISYTIYFDRRDKKMFELRQKAVRARMRQ